MQDQNDGLNDEIEELERRELAQMRKLRETRAELTRLREERRVARMTPEQRRADWRRRTAEISKRSMAIAATVAAGLATWFITQIRDHPVRPVAVITVVTVAAIIALLPRPGDEDDLVFPPDPPHAIRTPTPPPTSPTSTPTPSPSPTSLGDEDGGMTDNIGEVDAEGAVGGGGEIPGEDDDIPEPTPTDGPSATPTGGPTRMGTPSPTPTLPPPTTPPPTPSPTATPTPSPTETPDSEQTCLIYVDIPPLLELCLLGRSPQPDGSKDVMSHRGYRRGDGAGRGATVAVLPEAQGRDRADGEHPGL